MVQTSYDIVKHIAGPDSYRDSWYYKNENPNYLLVYWLKGFVEKDNYQLMNSM